MPKILPPGLSASRFASALKDFQNAVGKEFVITGDDDLEIYRDSFSLKWGEADEYLASAAVLPQTAEEVQAIVRIANTYKIPLYPISTGKNLTYGGAAPSYSGSVVVDLKRMNRILAVDDRRNFALVEPGVTYFDLYRYVKDKGLKVWLDVPESGWGSFIGNALDHGVGFTAGPFRDHFGSHCGMEVVLPTGEIMRTGMGALPNADSWQDFKYGIGPSVDGLFAQANFGIVTKMGFWLMPQPEATLTGVISTAEYTALGTLIEQVNYLEDSGLMTGRPVYHGRGNRAFEGRFPSASPRISLKELMANGWPSIPEIKHYWERHGGPWDWRVALQFYGPEKTIRANWEYAVDRITKAIPNAQATDPVVMSLPLTAEQEKTAHRADFGIPNMDLIQTIFTDNAENLAHVPFQGHNDFMAVIPRTGEAVHKAHLVFYETQKALGLPITATPFQPPTTWHHRSFLMGAPTIAAYQNDPERNKKGRVLYEAYVKAFAAAGFGVYRTTPAMQDLVVDQYSFNDHALLHFQERLKDAADPNGVIAPGRYGIWPKDLRKRKA